MLPMARASSSLFRTVRTRIAMRVPRLDLLERRVLEHQLPLGPVFRKADGDHTAGLDADHDALAERAVPDRVAGRESREVGARLNGRRRGSAVVRPGARSQALAHDLSLRKLVEEPG